MSVSNKLELDRKLRPFDYLLGKRSESKIAWLAGVVTAAVVHRRKRLGIPSHLEAFDHLLGTLTDEDLAAQAEVTKQTITARGDA